MAVPKTQKEQLGVDDNDPDPGPQIQAVSTEVEEEPVVEAPVDERPAWLPEKFKSEEDFAKSYGALEEELRQRGNREREMAGRMEQLEALAMEAQRQPQAQADDPMAVYADELALARENGDARREAELHAWLVQQTIGQAFQGNQQRMQAEQAPFMQAQHEMLAVQAKTEMTRRYDDWQEKEDRIAQLLESDPDLLPDSALASYQGTVNALERAYKLVEVEDLRAQMETMREQGVTAADVSRAKKLSTQTLSGSSGRPGEPSEADRHLAEMQGALRGSSWEHGQAPK